MGKFVDCDVTLLNGLPDGTQVRDSVVNEATSILQRIDALYDTSDKYDALAEAIVKGLGSFRTNINDIEYEFEIGDYEREGYVPFGAPDVYRDASFNLSDLSDPAEVKIKPFEASVITAPAMPTFDFPEAPTLPPVGAAPVAPNVGSLPDVPPSPDVTITIPELLALPDFVQMAIDLPDIAEVEFLDPTWLDLPDVDESALDRYKSIADNPPELVPYDERVIREGLTAAEAMLAGNFVIDIDALEAGTRANAEKGRLRYSETVSKLWARRGMPDVREGLGDHLARVSGRISADLSADHAALVERWRMKLLPVALQLNVETHTFLVDKLTKLLDVEFEILLTQAEAQIGLYAAASAKYRALLARIAMQSARYKHRVATVRAGMLKYAAWVDTQKAVAQLNQAKGSAYAITQSIQGVSVDMFAAQLDVAKAQVQAYSAQMRGIQAQAQAIGVQLAQYEGESAQWRAELVRVKTDYSVRKAENQSIVALNRAFAAQVSAESAGVDAVAMEATRSAQAISSEAATLRARIAQRLTGFAGLDARNALSAAKYRASGTGYRVQAAEQAVGLLKELTDYAAIDSNNSTISRLVSAAADPVTRAAQATQQLQSQVASAYVDLAKAAADSEAARLSGKAARIRASTSLSARGDIQYSEGLSKSSSFGESVSDSQNNTCSTEFKNIYM